MDGAPQLPPLGHVGYVVRDVNAEAEGFRRLLGIEAFHVYDYVPIRAWAHGKVLSPCRLRIAMGSLESGTRIELIQPVEGDTPHARFLRQKGPGPHHVAFTTERYEQFRRHLLQQGAEIVFEAEAEDDRVGYRRSFYAQVSGMAALVEISDIPRKRT